MNLRCVAVLGWRDEPTDAVLEYCEYLGTALPAEGITLEFLRVRWTEVGWARALAEVRESIGSASGTYFIVQYTALTWSRRGFAMPVLRLIRTLQKSGARCAVMFHDSEGYPGARSVDRLRRALQLRTMRRALRMADVAIFNVPPAQCPWVPRGARNAVFIPVGANLPSPENAWNQPKPSTDQARRVAVFSLAEGPTAELEIQAIETAARKAVAKLAKLELVVLGRNSESGGELLKKRLENSGVEITVYGILPAATIVNVLGTCDAMLFAKGPISTRRGSAIAGIACGLPVIGQSGWETAAPITEAGVELVPPGEAELLGDALLRVLGDGEYRSRLAARSRAAQDKYFSWQAIAAQYAAALKR